MTIAASIGHLQACTDPQGLTPSVWITCSHVSYLYVTGFAKTVPNGTRIEIQIIA